MSKKHTTIRMTNSLADLRDALIALEKECREEGCKLEDKIDLTDLPTFGGEQPSDTQGIFSWDEENLLTCESIWKIVSREDEEDNEEQEEGNNAMLKEVEVSVYRKGQSKRIALCPLQLQPDPSEEQGILEYNADDVAQAISAAIEADRGIIQEVTVQNPFVEGEAWEVLFGDGERGVYLIEYEVEYE